MYLTSSTGRWKKTIGRERIPQTISIRQTTRATSNFNRRLFIFFLPPSFKLAVLELRARLGEEMPSSVLLSAPASIFLSRSWSKLASLWVGKSELAACDHR